MSGFNDKLTAGVLLGKLWDAQIEADIQLRRDGDEMHVEVTLKPSTNLKQVAELFAEEDLGLAFDGAVIRAYGLTGMLPEQQTEVPV
jgi:hypothetical protein